MNEVREGRSKSVVVPEAIDVVRQLILQDHVTYREIETTSGISGSIYSILHEHLTVKKICSRWTHIICQSLKKNQLIRVEKVFRQLVPTRVKVYRS